MTDTNMSESLTHEELVELGKSCISYSHQVGVFGKEAADNVLHFWVLGFQYRSKQIAPLIKGSDAVEFAEWINSNDYEKIHGDRWCKIFMSYTHSSEELYEIFTQTKKG